MAGKMKKRFLTCTAALLGIVLLSACGGGGSGGGSGPVQFIVVTAFPGKNASNALDLDQHPGNPDRWYLVRQNGQILTFDSTDANAPTTFIDISCLIVSGGEYGLMSLVFHPDFATNGTFYLSYTEQGPDFPNEGLGNTVLISHLAALTSVDGGLTSTFDCNNSSTWTELRSINQPFDNHNGGHMAFEPGTRLLYWSMGDGGSGNDPGRNGQDMTTNLGAILRFDLTTPNVLAVPADNPFVGIPGDDDIWAYGLRNPWRFSFDSMSGDLWAGDVGQGALEEVDLITRGGNYGWRCFEGDQTNITDPECVGITHSAPVHVYPRVDGRSITGGYVYRGSAIADLFGQYVFGDFITGNIWALVPDPGTGSAPYTRRILIDGSGISIASFTEAADGEIYIVDLFGEVRRLEVQL